MAHLATRPTNLRDATEALRGKRERKIGNNTWLHLDINGDVAMRLHDTDIVTYAADGITLDSGGWMTPTTKDRMNQGIHNTGWFVYSERGAWYLANFTKYGSDAWTPQRRVAYSDGCKIDNDGNLTGTASKTAQDNDKATRKTIAAYAKHCADHLQDLGVPSNGDCLYCHMYTQDGESLGDASGNTDHLEMHLEESYYVPSLIINALRDSNATDLILSVTWQVMEGKGDGRWPEDIARQQVQRSVKKFLTRRLGLAG